MTESNHTVNYFIRWNYGNVLSGVNCISCSTCIWLHYTDTAWKTRIQPQLVMWYGKLFA